MHLRRMQRRAVVAAAAALALATTACDDDDDVLPLTPAERAAAIRTLVEVGVGNPSRIVRAGQPVRVAARVTDPLNVPVEGASVVWSGSGSVATDGASTGLEGIVRGTWTAGTTAGVQELVATVAGNENVFDRTAVVVFADTVVGTLVLESARTSIPRGDTTRVVITDARDRYGNAYILVGTQPDNPPPISFSSLDPSIATLRSTTAGTALVAGVAAGTARIVARSDGKADTVAVTVTP